MSFLNSLKKSLGLEADTDDELFEDSAAAESEEEAPIIMPQPTDAAPELSPDTEIELDDSKVEMIFRHVVEIFDEALPMFIRGAVDRQAQQKMLYDGLESSLKEYINSVKQQAFNQCEARWASEQSNMRSEMDSLREKARQIEQQRFDIKQQQLSADRQKRALTERVHDLEIQVASLEAEREQYDLENKSLLNKLKVANVHETESEDLRKQLTDALEQISKLRNEKAGDRIGEAELAKTNAELSAANSRLQESLDAAVEKDRLSTEMFNDLQHKASEAREKVDSLTEENEQLKAKLAESENLQQEIDEITQQMEKIDEVISKRDAKIANLKKTNENLNKEIENLRKQIEELKSDPITMSAADIEDVEQSQDTETEVANDTMLKISDGDLEDIEQGFDENNWLQSEPVETPSMRVPLNENEFGYQSPTKKNNVKDNDAQLSLF